MATLTIIFCYPRRSPRAEKVAISGASLGCWDRYGYNPTARIVLYLLGRARIYLRLEFIILAAYRPIDQTRRFNRIIFQISANGSSIRQPKTEQRELVYGTYNTPYSPRGVKRLKLNPPPPHGLVAKKYPVVDKIDHYCSSRGGIFFTDTISYT